MHLHITVFFHFLIPLIWSFALWVRHSVLWSICLYFNSRLFWFLAFNKPEVLIILLTLRVSCTSRNEICGKKMLSTEKSQSHTCHTLIHCPVAFILGTLWMPIQLWQESLLDLLSHLCIWKQALHPLITRINVSELFTTTYLTSSTLKSLKSLSFLIW